MLSRVWTGLVCLAGLASAQQPAVVTSPSATALPVRSLKVDPHNTYSRIIAVVPILGSGTKADPRRPKYAPWPPVNPSAVARNNIIGFSHITTDDGKSAIVEFVARDRSAFQTILADKSITVFEKGKDTQSDIETALQKVKKDFTLNKYSMAVQ